MVRFYNVKTDKPLSQYHNTSAWQHSILAQLLGDSDGNVWIDEIPQQHRGAAYGWRVVDAYWSDEDTTMTRFRAFGLDGEPLLHAAFGVTYNGCESRITGGFKYPPSRGSRYYVPVDNAFHTPNTGGYLVQVLDLDNPSEALAFGLSKAGNQHQALVITFRLFALRTGYPNDR